MALIWKAPSVIQNFFMLCCDQREANTYDRFRETLGIGHDHDADSVVIDG